MGQALYRKYRSKSLSEVVGQEHITTALTNALKQGRISHAYLLTGPRGVGKTSIARILAYEVNGLPYDEQATHLDIIEIDAASNRRIDEIRELREKVHNAPANARYKVYIIDEVHMLTKEAFNALLKTLEEPPAHAIFILATTESHKLPETIISRTQRFTFKPIDKQQVVDHLAYIAKTEKIEVSKEALELIAQHGGGSFRDSISLLDQAGNTGKRVELSDIQRMLGIAPDQAINELIQVLQSGTTADLVRLMESFRDHGYQATQLAKQLAGRLRVDLINETVPFAADKVSKLLHELLTVPASHDPATTFELLLIDQIIDRLPPAVSESAPKPIEKEVATDISESPKSAAKADVTPPPKAERTTKPTEKTESAKVEATSAKPMATSLLSDETWSEVLSEIRTSHNTLYGIARMAQPHLQDNTLTLTFAFPFHQKRVNEAKNKQIICDIIARLTGVDVAIVCVTGEIKSIPKAKKPEAEKESNDALNTISNIFGSAEILE
jgi:DNA polymerase III subunit gamma/tau